LRLRNCRFTIYYDYWNDSWYADLTLLFTESAGVGANVTLIEVNWLQDGLSIASTRVAGKRVPAHGSVYVNFRTEFPAKYKPQKRTIAISGCDDNGYAFNKTKSYDITWNSKSALINENKYL